MCGNDHAKARRFTEGMPLAVYLESCVKECVYLNERTAEAMKRKSLMASIVLRKNRIQ